MFANVSHPMRRRSVVAAGLAAAVGSAAGLRRAGAKGIFLRGMSGGGLAQMEGETEVPGLANFGLFASATQMPEGESLVLGRIYWIEAGTDLRLDALEVRSCVPIPKRTDGAEVRGRMSVNGDGSYPFVIRAFDAGRPGSGLDRIEVEVNTDAAREGSEPATGDASFAYQAAATLVAGDLLWIIEDVLLDG